MPVRGGGSALAAGQPLVRAVAFAGTSLVVSLIGHVCSGGHTPDHATVLLAGVLVMLCHLAGAGRRELSWPTLSGALLAGQFGLHLVFDAGPMPGGHAHLQALPPALGMRPGPMLLGHLLAAAVLGWFLRQGEQALWSAARRGGRGVGRGVELLRLRVAVLRALIARITRGGGPDRAATGRRIDQDPGAGRYRYLAGTSLRRRGPPADRPRLLAGTR